MTNTEGPFLRFTFGARDQVRTGDPQFGKLMLYRLSYSRKKRNFPSTLTVGLDFTDGLFPITWLMCTSEQGPKQSTLGHLCLSVWVANPMEPRFLSSVQVGLLSVSFRAGTRNRTEISTLEVWGNDRYTIPAVVTTPWEVSSRFT